MPEIVNDSDNKSSVVIHRFMFLVIHTLMITGKLLGIDSLCIWYSHHQRYQSSS